MKREILVDGSGNRVDLEGNRIVKNGYLLNDNGEHKLDDNGQYIMSTYLITSSSDSDNMLKEAISDTNVPAPPEEDESALQKITIWKAKASQTKRPGWIK